MSNATKQKVKPELKQIVREASEALTRLDAPRLEELARCCQALNREMWRNSAAEGADWARQAREAAGEFVVFTRVLEATRANLGVMMRLRAQHEDDRLEYGRARAESRHWAMPEVNHGND